MHRTNTADLTTITLPLPRTATFNFSPSSPAPASPGAIRITIPPSSPWRMPIHWHPSETNADDTIVPACQSVACVSGSLCVYTSTGIFRNSHRLGFQRVKFRPGERVAWYPNNKTVPLTVDLVADHTLWRNIGSAILDRDIFPRLFSTPLWLRVLFAILTIMPSWRNKLLDLILWIQLQTIFFAHDFRLFHGRIPFTWPWVAQPFGGTPPAWATRLDWRSGHIIAWAVMTLTYWAGTLFLGMKGEYVEYTPRSGHADEKREMFHV